MKRDSQGKFLPGNTGRPKGALSSHKLSSHVHKVFHDLIKNNLNTIKQDFESLSPKDRLEVICKMAPYVLPPVDSHEVISKTEKPEVS